MPRRSARLRALLVSLLPLAAACADEPPTLTGDEYFPGGSRPTTLEALIPADAFLETLGRFSGYASPGSGALILANAFEGVLQANALVKLEAFPPTVGYVQGGVSRNDTIRAFGPGQLIVRVDSVASAFTGPTIVRVFALGEDFDPATATYQLAVDTAGERRAFRVPGGTPGELLGEGTYTPALPGDSAVVGIDSALVNRLAANEFPGLLVTVATPGARLRVGGLQLRTTAHPRQANPDTAIAQTIDVASQIFVFTPEPPDPVTAFAAGGIRGARTLFTLRLDQSVPGCAPPAACAAVPLGDVTINEVSLLLRPVARPPGFSERDTIGITLRAITEPALGRRAPLGEIVTDSLARYAPGDTLVSVPLSGISRFLVDRDSTRLDVALLSEPAGATFGAAWFEPTPRLRIIYTLPVRTSLP